MSVLTRRWTMAIVVTLTVVALALVLSGEAMGSVNGVQPPASGDWVIDQDTTVLSETAIKLKGNLIVEPGYKLLMRNVGITFDCTFDGEYGFIVQSDLMDDGEIDISETTIQSKNSSLGWYFNISGVANLYDGVTLKTITNGIEIHHDDVVLTETTATTLGPYGIVVDSCNPTLGPDLKVSVTYETSAWDPIKRESRPDPGMALAIVGTSGDLASPTIDGIEIDLWMRDEWEGTVSTSTSCYERLYIYGIYASDAHLDSVKNVHISLDYEISANITYSYTSTYMYFYDYQYIYGVYLTGGSYIEPFENVTISDITAHTDAWQSGAISSYFRNYRYLYAVYNNIGSTGSVPQTWGGVTMRNQTTTYDTHGQFTSIYNAYYGYGIYWYPSTSAFVGTDLTLEHVVLDGLSLQRSCYFRERGEFTMADWDVSNCTFSSYFLYLSSWNYPVTVENTKIINNTMTSYFVYCARWDSMMEFIGNNISYNTFRNVMFYDTQTSSSYDGDFLFEDNIVMENTFLSYWVYRNLNGWGDWTFDGNLFMNNTFNTYFICVQSSSASNTCYGDFMFLGNNFTGNKFYAFLRMYYFKDGDLIFEDNVFDDNTGSYSYFMYYYGYSSNQGKVDSIRFLRNTITDNSFSGSYGLGYFYYVYGEFQFNDNIVRRNKLGANYGMYAYLRYATRVCEFEGNVIDSNTIGMYSGFHLYYPAYNLQSFELVDNEITNNSGGGTYDYYGVITLYYLYRDLVVSDNLIEGNRMKAICIDYLYGYTYANNEFLLTRNEIVNNSASGVYIYNGEYFDIEISDNTGTLNSAYPIRMDCNSYAWGGPSVLIVEGNDFTNNPGGGLYLRVYFFDTRYTYDYRDPNQWISIKKNDLRNNGEGGWALAIVDFHKMPTIKNNDLTGSAMGQYLELTKSPILREDVNLYYRDMVVDGGANGITAYGFGDITVEFLDCTFLNYTEAVFAKDCVVNIWHCSIPEASGKTEGSGRIFVWNWLEIWVTWANATGVDSGVPVDGALIALRGANTKYYGGLSTDEEGKLGPILINPWTCVRGEMDAWAPFETTIMSEGISTSIPLHVVGDLLAPDPALMLLVDDILPAPTIAFPQDGMLVGDEDLRVEGFLFEVGSGVDVFEGRTDMMAEDEWVPIRPDVIWEHEFPGMSEGAHEIVVRTSDVSGNWNMTNISVIIDYTEPELSVRMLYLDGEVIEFNETRGGFFVSVYEIVVNGTYSDNIAHMGNVRIRFNGVYEYIFPSQWGKINKRIALVEGFNTVIVDATDPAGNRIVEELVIIRDTHKPSVYVWTPIQNEETANPDCLITGKSEPGVRVELAIVSSAGTKDYSTMTDDDGMFAITVELFEGPQKILIDAIDPAGNINATFRDVVLDTIPPDFIINNPPETEIVTPLTKFEIICTMLPGSLNARTYIGGQEVPNEGIIKRTMVLQEGANTVEILAIDPVGNGQKKVVTIVRDTIHPVLEVLEPTEDYMLTNKNMITFSGTIEGSDPAGGVFIEHNTLDYPAGLVSGDWVEYGEWEYTLELGPTDLEQEIRVWATDVAGNVVFWDVYVVYDEISPSLWLEEQPETTDSSILLVNGSTDDDVLEVYFQGVSFPVTGGFFSLAWPLNEGANVMNVEVFDQAGNSASDTIDINYVPRTVGNGDGGGGGEPDDNWTELWGWVILIAAITLIATAVIVSTQSRRR